MQDIVQLGHLNGTAHEIRALIYQLVLGRVLLIAIRVVNSLDVCLDLALNDATHLVGDRVAVLALAVNDSCCGV